MKKAQHNVMQKYKKQQNIQHSKMQQNMIQDAAVYCNALR